MLGGSAIMRDISSGLALFGVMGEAALKFILIAKE
jgi:hypothetical protein